LYKFYLDNRIKKNKIKSKVKIVTKIRYIDNYTNNKLFQVTKNENAELDQATNKNMLKIIEKLIKENDYIFIFDYGYFSSNNKVVDLINKQTYHKKIINCQTNSYNYGFNNFTKYKNCNTMCVDELEFRLAVKDKLNNIIDLFDINKKLLQKYKNLIVTMGKDGCAIRSKEKIDFIPTIFKIGKDTIGCGDIFMSILGMLKISNKFSLVESCVISHLAAGLHADTYGNKNVVNFQKIYKVIDNIIK
jgi:sugar/nucleoside kinase (ribokinase family)